jgi:glycosyltransferase involved in cell wall biosynthesis
MSVPTLLLLTRALDTGGAQRQLVALAIGLKQVGWKVTVATFYPGGALETLLRSAGVPVVSLDKRGRWDVLPFTWRLIQLIRRERPQFAKGYLVMSNVLLSALRPALRETRVVWGLAASDMDLTYYDLLSRIEFRLSILLSRFAHLIISNSEAGRRYHIAQGYCADRVVVIPNGIDVEQFRCDATARAELRAEWKTPPHVPLIGLVGRIDPMKDHANFLRAAAQIGRAHPAARFVCVGPGKGLYRDQMVALCEALGLGERLTWAGERMDTWRVYNALDLLVSSSRSEGLPNVVAEAMATGVRCVVTDVGDSAQIVGKYGWVCPPGDSDALARAVVAALSALPVNPAPLRQHICDHYSTAALVQRTAEQLRHLVSDATVEWRVVPD